MNTPTIIYLVIIGIYFVFGTVFASTTKKKISKKTIILLSSIMLLLFIAYSIYYWKVEAKLEDNALREYLIMFFLGVITGFLTPTFFITLGNVRLLMQETMRQMTPQEKDKLALEIGYKKLLKNKYITKEEYEQKERELFDDYQI